MAQLAAVRYATALFELSLEEKTTDALYEEVLFVRDILANDDELVKIIGHPQITTREKHALIEKIFKRRISDTLLGLLFVVIRKGRESELDDIFSEFISKYRQHKAVTTAEIVSASELSPEQLARIKSNLSDKISKQVEIVTRIDETLIGGLCIKVDGNIIDGSIKKQINDIKKQLHSIRLA